MTTTRAMAPRPHARRPASVPPFAVISGLQVQECTHRPGKGDHRAGRGDLPGPRCGGLGESPVVLPAVPRPADVADHRAACLARRRTRVDGLKWISSFPDNVEAGIPRASAVLILNDHGPAIRSPASKASIISAARTAASAALGADYLSRDRRRPTRIGFVGVGLIARYIHTFLLRPPAGRSTRSASTTVAAESVAGFDDYLRRSGDTGAGRAARQPRVADPLERPRRLRDGRGRAARRTTPRGSTTIRWSCTCRCATSRRRSCCESTNIVDDVEHCLKADTSPHLAEQLTGNRDFVDGHPGRRDGRPGQRAARPDRWCSHRSGSVCSTWRSASTSTTS